MAELFKLVQIENSKRKKLSAKQKQIEKNKQKKIKREAEKKVKIIRQNKKKNKQQEKYKPTSPKPILKIGDRVRMENGRAIGTIDRLEKNKAVVNYGIFTTNVNINLLELVESN